ncbi:MAG: DUF3870 domain-containing protein [Maledivibacter sp.]|jgi:hypothetical protein|nr:DUF3870 domain-containing protein [Maledivibacter sp.]
MVNVYRKNTVYVVGHAKTSNDNAITERFKLFFIGFVIDTDLDEVVDAKSTATIDITSEFIKSMFLGQKFDKYYKEIEDEVKRRYFGTSQRAIIVAYKDAVKKYTEVKQRYY